MKKRGEKIIHSILAWSKLLLLGFYYSFVLFFFRLFKVDNQKIMIVNYYGKGYGDMGKSIAEELRKNPPAKIYWAVKEKYHSTIPNYITPIKYNSISYLYHLATSKIWINNTRFEFGIHKRKNQYYIQTWHGGLGLKKIEKEAEDLPSTYILQAKKDSKMIGVMISNSNYRTDQYLNNFWYQGNILECELPRNDIFFQKNNKKEIRTKLGINEDDVVLLYAPTVRSYSYDYNQINFNNIIEEYQKKHHKNLKVLLRLHPNIADKVKIVESNHIKNVSTYSDAYELLLISNILISDYSSILFDFLYTKEPVYLYAPDKNEYIGARGMNFDYDELPFSKSYTSKELVQNIVNEDAKNYERELKEFLEKMGIVDDGHASERIVNLINKVIKGEEINYEKI